MPVDAEEVRRIAALARLQLGSDEVERLRTELQAILDYVTVLDTVDLDEVAPTARPPLSRQPLRADDPEPSLSPRRALGGAPRAARGHFRVPRVLEG